MVMENGGGDFDEQEQFSGGVRIRVQDRVVSIDEYGYGDHAATLERVAMALSETQFTEGSLQLMRRQLGNRCYTYVVSLKPRVFDLPGSFEWDSKEKTYAWKSGDRVPAYIYFNIFDSQGNRLAKPIPGPLLVEERELMVMTPELNQTIPREDIGPDGQYPKWLWYEKNRRYLRSYHRMRRYLRLHPGASKFEAFRVLTEQDEAIKRQKQAEAQPFFEAAEVLLEQAESLSEAYPIEALDCRDEAKNLQRLAKELFSWDYAPYSVLYPFVGAVGHQPTPEDHFTPADWVYQRTARQELVPSEADPRDFVILDEGILKPFMYVDGEFKPFTPPYNPDLVVRAQEEIALRIRQRHLTTGENKRFGLQENFPDRLYYNFWKEQYEVYICDLDFRGRTALAHRDCWSEIETQQQVWTLFEETARRKGFKTLRREDLDDPNLSKEERQKIWNDYLKRLDAFVSEFYDRSYPSEQITISKVLSRIFGAQGWDPKSMAKAKQDLVNLLVWVENPPEVTWDWDSKRKEYTPHINYRPFRYRAKNIERLRKVLHWIQSWQTSRGVHNRREEGTLDSAAIARYVSNNLGGEWESRPYRQDARANYHLRVANHFASLDLIRSLQPDLEEWERTEFEAHQIEDPTEDQIAEFEMKRHEFWDERVEEFRYFVELRRSILDWAWFFKEPWMKMPHDGSLTQIFCESWVAQLDGFAKERGLNSAAGDGAFPKWDTFVDKYTSQVRDYRNESDWSGTLEMAKRDPFYTWKDLKMILGGYNVMGVVQVRVSGKSTYELWPEMWQTWGTATRIRTFMKLMWRNIPVDPLMESIDHDLSEAEANGITETLEIPIKHMVGMPSLQTPHGIKKRYGTEFGNRLRRERAVDWMVNKALGEHNIGTARGAKNLPSWIAKLGFGFRLLSKSKSKKILSQQGLLNYYSAKLDNFQGKAEYYDDHTMHKLNDEDKIRKENLLKRAFSWFLYYQENILKRKPEGETAKMLRWELILELTLLAGFPDGEGPKSGNKMNQAIQLNTGTAKIAELLLRPKMGGIELPDNADLEVLGQFWEATKAEVEMLMANPAYKNVDLRKVEAIYWTKRDVPFDLVA